eukprot:403374442
MVEWKQTFDRLSRFLDPVFATCLIALGVIRIIFLQVSGAADIVLVGYYFLFALILYFSMIKREVVYKYLGFLSGTFSKGLFYIFLATLAFCRYTFWANILFGCVLGGAAVLNMIRYFQGSKDQRNDEPVL